MYNSLTNMELPTFVFMQVLFLWPAQPTKHYRVNYIQSVMQTGYKYDESSSSSWITTGLFGKATEYPLTVHGIMGTLIKSYDGRWSEKHMKEA